MQLNFFKIIVSIILCLILLVSLIRCCTGRRREVFDLPEDVPYSLRRGPHSVNTRRQVASRHVDLELRRRNHGPAHIDNINQGVERMGEAGGFHARHMWSDWFYRRALVAVLRAPTPELVETVRAFFVAANANNLVIHLDNMLLRLRAAAPGANWYHVIGRINVNTFRNLLNNMTGLLFSGRREGNYEAGTAQDITTEAIAQLGRQDVERVNAASVELLQRFNLGPFVNQLNDQIAMDFEGSYRNLTGRTNTARTQEERVNPAIGLVWHQSARVWMRAPFHVQLRAAIRMA